MSIKALQLICKSGTPIFAPLFSAVFLLLASFLLLFSKVVFAGADTTQVSHYPRIKQIEFNQSDVIFDNKYILKKGNWNKWQPIQKTKIKTGNQQLTKNLNCKVPDKVVEKLVSSEMRDSVKILKCDLNSIWFSSGSYCSEGLNEQAGLYRYNIKKNIVKEYENAIPECNSIVNIAIIGNELWIATNHPGEYGPYPGKGIVRYDYSLKIIKEIIPSTSFSGSLFHSMSLSPGKKILWVATDEGIDKFYIDSKKIESQYFHLDTIKLNRKTFGLQKITPAEDERWLNSNLYFFPIHDVAGFSRAWRSIKTSKYKGLLFKDKKLFPFYMQALKIRYKEYKNNNNKKWYFSRLLKNLAGYEEPSKEFKQFIQNIDINYIDPDVAAKILKYRKKFGIKTLRISSEKYFDDLMKSYFFVKNGVNQSGSEKQRTLCEMSHESSARMRKVVDIYLNNNVHKLTDKGFYNSCIVKRSDFKYGHEALPMFIAAMKGSFKIGRKDPCQMFNQNANVLLRTPEAAVAAIHARVRTSFWPGRTSSDYMNCKIASYWLTNTVESVQKIIDEDLVDLTMVKEAKDILEEVTQKKFENMSEWKEWWKKNMNKFVPRTKEYSMN